MTPAIVEEIVMVLEVALFLVVAYCMASSFATGRKARQHIKGEVLTVVNGLLPLVLLPSKAFDDEGRRLRLKSISLMSYAVATVLLGALLAFGGVELVAALDP